ncbi:tripartite tricarboxylate transporter TctB family protein [Streptomyces sp. N35]|uniref:tripartite tricarboxylate transporter TctB family protein n=1 Tax=Streptomyces sp. N35 TaxID=2795730 RepID=UPI0018F7A8E7|nr:tripartite tricarboxylate transporter TctB family protein [Streptomyces sp. N35]
MTTRTYARRQNVVAALVPLAVGVGAAILSWNLGVGTLAAPGAGMWPLIVSITMVVTAAVLLLDAQPRGDEEGFTKDSLTVAVSVSSLVAYALLFEVVGFEIPTVAVLVLWLRVLGREGWLLTVGISTGTTAALHLLFITALGIPLPHLIAW